jgi:hypothetical protein
MILIFNSCVLNADNQYKTKNFNLKKLTFTY